MTPGSFDTRTAREVLGDSRAQAIEQKARADADAREYRPPKVAGETYFTQVLASLEVTLYAEQYIKRTARSERKGVGGIGAPQ